MEVATKKTKLCIIEEQEIFRKLYQSLLSAEYEIDFMEDFFTDQLTKYITDKINPNLLLISVKKMDENTFGKIIDISRKASHPGIILLLLSCNHRDITFIRKLASVNMGGLALFMKQSLDLSEQLVSLIQSVQRGQVILDPAISGMLLSSDSECPFLKQMTSREQEILGLLASGYTNAAIAKSLFIDLKTVEHHINNMYGKLRSVIDFDQRHPRVQAARLYLEAVGELPRV